MKSELVNSLYEKVFNYKIKDENLNNIVKAVVLDFPDGEVIVENDNYGTCEKHMDFTEGKKKAGLHPLQIVFAGLDIEKVTNGVFIGSDDNRHSFKDIQIESNEA